MKKYLGYHVIIEAYGINKRLLRDLKKVEKLFIEACKVGNLPIVSKTSFKFGKDGGISINIIIAESHLSLHSWPEYGYAAIDIYTCSSLKNTMKAVNYIIKKIKPKEYNSLLIYRGDILSKKVRIKKKRKLR